MKRSLNRPASATVLTGVALAASLLLTPATASAAPILAETGTEANGASGSADGCEVTGGELRWGLKESFRSYISGSIAKGAWEPSDGAGYETPEFIFTEPSGSIDPESGTGSVSFTGTVHFTGHEGVLDLTLANPTIEFEGDGKAALLLDTRSTDMEGNLAVDAQQEWVGAVTVDDEVAPSGDALELSKMPVKLTNSGAGAFAGFYEADAELDPLTVSLEFDGCEGGSAAAASDDEDQADGEVLIAEAPQQQVPWLPIAIGGVALLVIGFTVGMLVGGRQRKSDARRAADSQGAAAGEL